ncbi:MAG: TPM domain-containing protein [Clostridia bacterium]|nr:TPM domain-containing protein [Clostridia bacterium]
MKRKTINILPVLLSLCFMFMSCFSAYARLERMVDGAGLLTEYERDELSDMLDTLSEDDNIDYVILTADDIANEGYADINEYADYYYENNGFMPDGVMLAINMAGSDYCLLTKGECNVKMNEDNLDILESVVVPYLSSGDYYSAFVAFAENSSQLITNTGDDVFLTDSGVADTSNFIEPEYASEPKTLLDKLVSINWPVRIIVCLGIGLLIGFIVTGSMKSKHKSVASLHGAADYEVSDSLNVLRHNDVFLYKSVNTAPKAKASDSSVISSSDTFRSSVNIPSSGSSHGGRSGKF